MIVNFWVYSIIRARDLVSLKAIAWGISHNKIVILMSHWCWNLMTFCPHQNKGAVARIIILSRWILLFHLFFIFLSITLQKKDCQMSMIQGAKVMRKLAKPFQNWHPLVIQFQDSLFLFFFFQDLNVVKRRLAYHWKFNN